jgi:hypothetical protein
MKSEEGMKKKAKKRRRQKSKKARYPKRWGHVTAWSALSGFFIISNYKDGTYTVEFRLLHNGSKGSFDKNNFALIRETKSWELIQKCMRYTFLNIRWVMSYKLRPFE